MQAISSSSSAPSKTKQFPSKSDLIARVMNEFDLYHQFEFEQEIAQNDDMKYEGFDDLFKAGRAFKATITNYVDIGADDETEGKNIYADDGSSDSEDHDNDPKNLKKKPHQQFSTWFITLDLENQLNERYMGEHDLEEIAPAAKEKSAIHFLARGFSPKSGMFENMDIMSHATVLKRTGNIMEIVVTETNQNLNKLIKMVDNSDEWDESCFFACYNDMTTRRRIRELTDLMEELLQKRILMGQVLDYLVGKPPMPLENPRYDANLVEPQIQHLNASQKDSIRNYLTCESFYLTIGPPGTGKSEVICKFLELCHQMNYRVLVCSMSHAAVDNVLLRFARSPYYEKWRKSGFNNIVRHGSPFFIDPASKPYRKVFVEEKGGVEKFKFYNIHFSTLTASFSKYMRGYVEKSGMDFDYILVDEAAMCVDPFIFMAMSLGKKMILAGDHYQLKPIIKHEVVKSTTLVKSLFEKLVDAANGMRSGDQVQMHASKVYNILTVQYRMNNLIASPSSRYFYESKVSTHPPIAHIDLNGLSVRPGKVLSRKTPIVWVDHNGYESEGSMNQTEALIIARMVEDALYMGVKPSQIGVISAYRAQLCVINKALERKNILYPKSEMLVGTIDAFQGGEREVVIVATTRSNKGQFIGFLSSEERMNVAVTRAKRLCVFVGSAATLIKAEDSFIKEFYEFTRTHGEVLWYDRHKGTFKKANTSTQMSKPAVPGPKLDKTDYTASFSTAPDSKHNISRQLPQNLPRNHNEMLPGSRAVMSPWQPDPVPAQYHDYRQPAAFSSSASGASVAPQQPDWHMPGWSFTPETYHPNPNTSNHGHAPVWTHPNSRTNGSEMSISRTSHEALGMYPSTWGSSPSMQHNTNHYQPHQLQNERSKEPNSEFSGVPSTSSHHHQRPPAEVPKSNGNKLPVASKTPTDLKMSSGPGPRPTRAPVKKGPIQLMANPYAPPTAGWIPTAETGWDWHYEGRSATAFPAA